MTETTSTDSADEGARRWTQEVFNADEDDSDIDLWSTPAPAGGELAPFVDPGVEEAELEDGPPPWMGIRWRDIDASDRSEAWTALRQWVDWFIREYQVNASTIPACWFEHSDLVAELYAAMCAEYKIWEEGSPGLGAMTTWHPHVQALKARLLLMSDEHTCSINAKKAHVPDVVALPWNYDEARWAALRDGGLHSDDLPRSDTARLWRPITVDKDGEINAGAVIRVRGNFTVPASPEAVVVLSDAAGMVAQGRFLAAGPAAESYWEYACDDGTDEWYRHVPADTGSKDG